MTTACTKVSAQNTYLYKLSCRKASHDEDSNRWIKCSHSAKALKCRTCQSPAAPPLRQLAIPGYFAAYKDAMNDDNLMWLPTDECLHTDPKFKEHFDRYAKDQVPLSVDCEEVVSLRIREP